MTEANYGTMTRGLRAMGMLINDTWVEFSSDNACQTVLEWLRESRLLQATKEGCGAGDCGACSVLVGRMHNGKLIYESINACIAMLGSMDGCHLVTLEAMGASVNLHPVQRALVDYHGSQCGFCTPGITMAMIAWWLNTPPNDLSSPTKQRAHRHELIEALSGNLCRCTGYNSIFKAAASLADSTLGGNLSSVRIAGLCEADICTYLESNRPPLVGSSRYHRPSNMNELAWAMDAAPTSTLIAGSTDLGLEVTQHLHTASSYIDVSNVKELKSIAIDADNLRIGAGVTYSELETFLGSLNETQRQQCAAAAWEKLLSVIGSRQVRNRGTIGGNVANASPIADSPPLLLALDARLVLRVGIEERQIQLDDFYLDYKQTQLRQGEIIASIVIPLLDQNMRVYVEKVSKRKEDDISAVCVAMVCDGVTKTNRHCRIGLGGMATTPLRAKELERAVGSPRAHEWDAASVLDTLSSEISPLSDVRASAAYRLNACANLLSFWLQRGGQ